MADPSPENEPAKLIDLSEFLEDPNIPHIAGLLMVKNEADRIETSLQSLIGVCKSLVIYDTGSTDNTPEIVKTFAKTYGMPLHLKHGEFVDFSTSRNVSLDFADTFPEIDYVLLLDSNDELRRGDLLLSEATKYLKLPHTAFHVKQRLWFEKKKATNEYFNTRLLKTRSHWRYKMRVHEYLFKAKEQKGPKESLRQLDARIELYQDRDQDVAKSTDRFKRDRKWLEEDHEKTPKDTRILFYLAQTYGELGMWEQAVQAYVTRGEMTHGFFEERYISWMRAAKISNWNLKFWEQAESFYMKAFGVWNRPEPLVHIGEHYQIEKKHQEAYMFLHQACRLEVPKKTILFQNPQICAYKRWHVLGIVAFYVKEFDEGIVACSIALKNGQNKEVDQKNLNFYLEARK